MASERRVWVCPVCHYARAIPSSGVDCTGYGSHKRVAMNEYVPPSDLDRARAEGRQEGWREAIKEAQEAFRGRQSRYGSGLTVREANLAADFLARTFPESQPHQDDQRGTR
jgi:hypothetical protein